MSVPLRWQEPEILQERVQVTRMPLRPTPASRSRRLGATFVVWACFGGMILCGGVGFQLGRLNGFNENSPSALHLVSTPSASAKVLLSNANVERRVGFITVTGTVLSRAKSSLSNVEMVVELLDAQNRTLKMESALISNDPLPPDGTSAFSVVIQDDPHAVRYRVRSRKLFGGALD